jgi:hypothetical protein
MGHNLEKAKVFKIDGLKKKMVKYVIEPSS